MSKMRHWSATTFLMCLAVLSAGGCGSSDARSRDVPDADPKGIGPLPVWTAEIDLSIGQAEETGHDFVAPVPLGADTRGLQYVIDPRLQEIRQFDQSGEYLKTVVRSGGGPGEMRLPPQTFGMKHDSVWYTEAPTGRVHYVALDGTGSRIEDTGWSPPSLGTLMVSIYPLPIHGEYRVTSLSITNPFNLLRPLYHVKHYHARGDSMSLFLEYSGPGQSIHFDGGLTTTRYPGPPDQPVILFGDGLRYLRIDRPDPAGNESAIANFELFSSAGNTLRRGSVAFPAVRLSSQARDSIVEALLRTASLGGGRTVEASVRQSILQFVDAIPDQRPAFDVAFYGADGTVWLRPSSQEDPQVQTWVVVDSTFTPIREARLPNNVVTLSYTNDETWWATLRAEADVIYVARLRFAVEPDSR